MMDFDLEVKQRAVTPLITAVAGIQSACPEIRSAREAPVAAAKTAKGGGSRDAAI